MSQLGIGVMINMLGGNEKSAKTFSNAIGKEIKSLEIIEDELIFEFTDGEKIALFDDGQSCCEHRYMHTDDNLKDFVGAKLQTAEIQPGEDGDYDYGVKESEFLIVTTSKGQFTVVNYNEHNGYYGGFAIRCRAI